LCVDGKRERKNGIFRRVGTSIIASLALKLVMEGLTDVGDAEQAVTTAEGGNNEELGLSTQSKMRKRWNAALDVCLLREIALHEPFAAPHGQTQERWAACVNALNENQKEFPWPVDARGCRDRFNILVTQHRRGEKTRKGTGGSEEDTLRRAELLQEVVERLDDQIRRQKLTSSAGKTPQNETEDPENARMTPLSTSVKRRRLDMDEDEFEAAATALGEARVVKDFSKAWRAIEERRIELEHQRLRMEEEDRKKARELEASRLAIEKERSARESEERRMLYDALKAIGATKLPTL